MSEPHGYSDFTSNILRVGATGVAEASYAFLHSPGGPNEYYERLAPHWSRMVVYHKYVPVS